MYSSASILFVSCSFLTWVLSDLLNIQIFHHSVLLAFSHAPVFPSLSLLVSLCPSAHLSGRYLCLWCTNNPFCTITTNYISWALSIDKALDDLCLLPNIWTMRQRRLKRNPVFSSKDVVHPVQYADALFSDISLLSVHWNYETSTLLALQWFVNTLFCRLWEPKHTLTVKRSLLCLCFHCLQNGCHTYFVPVSLCQSASRGWWF